MNPSAAQYGIAAHSHGFAITIGTPSPSYPTRGLMVATGGTLTVTFNDDSTTVQLTLVAGVYYPFAIKATTAGGTAAGLVGFN